MAGLSPSLFLRIEKQAFLSSFFFFQRRVGFWHFWFYEKFHYYRLEQNLHMVFHFKRLMNNLEKIDIAGQLIN